MSNIETLAKENGMTVEFVNWFFETKKDGCGNAWFMMMAAMWEGWKAQESRCAALAAENAGLKAKGRELLGEACAVYAKFNKLIDPAIGDFIDGQTLHEFQYVLDCETPATDAFLAEVRAQGVDLVCDYHKSRCEALRDVDRNGSQRHGAALCDAIDIAYQIRKGVQS